MMGRKKGRGLRRNFHLELFVRITFPFPCLKVIHILNNIPVVDHFLSFIILLKHDVLEIEFKVLAVIRHTVNEA